VRENRTHGSEGGEGTPFPTPIGPGIQRFFRVLRYWMPDQVRRDGQNLDAFLNCDTVWQAGMQADSNWTPACGGVTIIL